MVAGVVFLASDDAPGVEVQRGMPIFSKEGLEVGKVAAVVLNSQDNKATQLLLCRLPERYGYWLVALEKIAEVRDGAVILTISATEIASLPEWRSSTQKDSRI